MLKNCLLFWFPFWSNINSFTIIVYKSIGNIKYYVVYLHLFWPPPTRRLPGEKALSLEIRRPPSHCCQIVSQRRMYGTCQTNPNLMAQVQHWLRQVRCMRERLGWWWMPTYSARLNYQDWCNAWIRRDWMDTRWQKWGRPYERGVWIRIIWRVDHPEPDTYVDTKYVQMSK